jgi:hypothetical protein
MGFLKSVLGKVTGLLNAVAPFAMFIPGLQWVSVAAMAANVLNGLAQKPPNWAGILTSVVSQAIPMGLGKAVQAFGGGTSMQFAKLFGDKLSGVLGEVSKKVANPTFTNLVGQLQSKLTSGAFLENVAAWANRVTGTKPGDILSQQQLMKGIQQFGAPTVTDLLGGIPAQLAQPLMQGQSGFSDSEQPKVVIQATGGQPLHPGDSAFAAPRDYRG